MSIGFLRIRKARPEDLIQRTVFQHIKHRGVPGLVALHVPNGGYRKPIEAAKLKGLGVQKGAPDVLLWHRPSPLEPGRSYAVELKSPDGRLSEAQAEMLARLEKAGVFTAVAHGLDQALAVLESWHLLRGRGRFA
jgi:hypothetical protein